MEQPKSKFDFATMMRKLDAMYDNEERVKNAIIKLNIELRQIQEDAELLQLMIMHQSNKEDRKQEWLQNGKATGYKQF